MESRYIRWWHRRSAPVSAWEIVYAAVWCAVMVMGLVCVYAGGAL